MPLFSLAYRSRSLIEEITPRGLREMTALLDVARARNQSLGVTGVLLFRDGLFAQILEGDESSVREVFESIQKDPRHHDVQILPRIQYDQRRFQKWSMAFVGPTTNAQAYYDRFSTKNGFEWTEAST